MHGLHDGTSARAPRRRHAGIGERFAACQIRYRQLMAAVPGGLNVNSMLGGSGVGARLQTLTR